jgi:hypothetical protein
VNRISKGSGLLNLMNLYMIKRKNVPILFSL